MDLLSNKELVTMAILTNPGVLAALIGLFANLIVGIINLVIAQNNRKSLRQIEESKKKDRIRTYRYETLFEIRRTWSENDSAIRWENNAAGKSFPLPAGTLTQYFFQECEKYNIISSLLEKKYCDMLEPKKQNAENAIKEMVALEQAFVSVESREEYRKLYLALYDSVLDFSETLQEVIHLQLRDLL